MKTKYLSKTWNEAHQKYYYAYANTPARVLSRKRYVVKMILRHGFRYDGPDKEKILAKAKAWRARQTKEHDKELDHRYYAKLKKEIGKGTDSKYEVQWFRREARRLNKDALVAAYLEDKRGNRSALLQVPKVHYSRQRLIQDLDGVLGIRRPNQGDLGLHGLPLRPKDPKRGSKVSRPSKVRQKRLNRV